MFSLCFPRVFLLFLLQNHFTACENATIAFNSTESDADNLTEVVKRFKALWPVREWGENGFFKDEYISSINRHWLQFPPPDKSQLIIFGIVYFIIMIFGAVGNVLVMFMFYKCKSLRSPANTLIVNLALGDFLITLETPIFIYNCYHRGPAFGNTACLLYGFLGGLSGTVSIITLSAISFDRYVVIKYPLHQSYSNLRLKLCLFIIWIYGLTFSIMPVLDIGVGKYTYEGYLTSCSFDYLTEDLDQKIFIFVFFVAAWVIPLIMIIFSYTNILKIVLARSVGNKNERHVKDEADKKQEIKVAFIVFCTICLWFVAWTPYATVALLGITGQKHLVTPMASMIPAVFCKIASCINPFIYGLSHPKYKAELIKLFCKSIKREQNKIWATQESHTRINFDSYRQPSDGVEIVEIDVEVMANPIIERVLPIKGLDEEKADKRNIKRRSSVAEMLCLQPNFSNKSSTLRKITRRLSAKEKTRSQDEVN